jgi:RNA polymerase sigma-70 factor (ECF subfamily)
MEKDEDFHLSSEKKEIEIEKLKNCISLIKQEQKLCVELFYLQSKSYVEIAQITGFSLKEVKSFLQNGKRNLKICMEKNERQ